MDPESFDRYQIEGRLGEGGMGVVYKGFDPRLKRTLAIKVMNVQLAADADLRERFYREAEAAAGLSHPNIVSVFDLGRGSDDRPPFIVMEYIEGEDLTAILKKDNGLSFSRKLELIADVCDGLNHAHSNGIVHRDVKPENIRVTRKGEVKIVDFGVAKLDTSGLTKTGVFIGTMSYASPEQTLGKRELDGRSDLFSAGVMLYEMVAKRKPFRGPGLAVLNQIASTPHPALTEVLPGCSPELSKVVDRSLAKDPDARYQSGLEMSQAIHRFVDRLPNACRKTRRQIQDLTKRLEAKRADLEKRWGELAVVPATEAVLETVGDTPAVDGDDGDDYGALLAACSQLSRLLESFPEIDRKARQASQSLDEAKKCFQKGDWTECAKRADEVLELSPENTTAFDLKARVREKQTGATVVQESPKRLLALLQKARHLEETGELDACRKAVQEALSEFPENADLLRMRATLKEASKPVGTATVPMAAAPMRQDAPVAPSVSEIPETPSAVAGSSAETAGAPPSPGVGQRPISWPSVMAGGLVVALLGLTLWWFLGPSGPAPPAADSALFYQAKAGDTLESVAGRFGIETDRLAEFNRLDVSGAVFAGQVLSLSAPSPDAGLLSVDILPWAIVDAIEVAEDDEPLFQGEVRTPFVINLPAGKYRLSASSPSDEGRILVFDVEVEAGARVQSTQLWPGFDPETAIDDFVK